MASDRRYTDEEFALVLRRAAEAQLQARKLPGPRQSGLTLDEMRSIAAEVGVDPDLVARLARELPEPGRSVLERLMGGPLGHGVELVVDRPLDEAARSAALDAIRGAMGEQGRVQRVGDRLEWTTASAPSPIAVNLAPRDDGTSVQILVERGGGAFLTFVISALAGVAGGGITAGIVDPSTLVDTLIVAGGVAGSATIVGQAIWRTTAARIRAKVSRVVETVTETLS